MSEIDVVSRLLISVIVPVYKVEEYLDSCVRSVLSQTYQRFELILVDDGSPDRCGQMCDQWAMADNRIRVIHQENGGLSAARNAGIDASNGELLCFVDSDDTIEPDYLEYLLHLLSLAPTVTMAVCGVRKSSRDRDFRTHEPIVVDSETALDILMRESELLGVYAWNKLYSRSIFETIRYPVGELYEDSAIIHLVVSSCESIAIGYEQKYNYRDDRAGNIVGTYSAKGCRQKKRHLDAIGECVNSKYPGASAGFCVYSLRSYCAMLKQLNASSLPAKERAKDARTYKQWMRPFLWRGLTLPDVGLGEKTNWLARRYLGARAYKVIRSILRRKKTL